MDSVEKLLATSCGGMLAPGSPCGPRGNFSRLCTNHWSSYRSSGRDSLLDSPVKLKRSSTSSILSRFRRERPPFIPWPKMGLMGAPMKSYCKNSSTVWGELEHRMLSAWNVRICLYGASWSQNQRAVKNLLIASWLVRVILVGSSCNAM